MLHAVAIGAVGKDAETKYFEGGTQKTTFSVGTKYYNAAKKASETLWVNCEIWGKQAEFAANNIKKGSKLTVIGSLGEEQYPSKDVKNGDGTPYIVKKLVLKATNIEYHSKKEAAAETTTGGGSF